MTIEKPKENELMKGGADAPSLDIQDFYCGLSNDDLLKPFPRFETLKSDWLPDLKIDLEEVDDEQGYHHNEDRIIKINEAPGQIRKFEYPLPANRPSRSIWTRSRWR